MSETRDLTIDEAIAMLPDGARIHTYLGIFGADWDREDILASIRFAAWRRTTDDGPTAMGHGLAIEHWSQTLYIETREAAHE